MSWTPAPGAIVAERFQLREELGRGGMGSVWAAHHLALDIPCAIKFVSDEVALADAEMRSRFQQEARAAARLKSRNVVQMLDHGVWHDSPYIAMELLEGESLRARLTRVKALGVEETLHIVRGVSKALAAAAELAIVHRDLKPENIFIVREGDEEIARVLDFGLAKAYNKTLLEADHRTSSGVLLGTPHYMSPEQIDGTRTLDVRSDLWSLSIITFECLTGTLPFRGDAVGNLLIKIATAPPPVPSQSAPHLPARFDDWWRRAAERSLEQRFATPEAWYSALADALGAPVSRPSHTPVVAATSADIRHSLERPQKSALSTSGSLSALVRPSSQPATGIVAVVALAAIAAAAVWFGTTRAAETAPAAAASSARVEPIASEVAASPAPIASPAPRPSASATPSSAPTPSASAPPPAPRPLPPPAKAKLDPKDMGI